MGRSFLLMSFKCSQRVGLSIMSLQSPRHPQSNGKAENSLRTVKRLFEKCKETSVSECQALLDFRNTPPEVIDTSPVQHLMSRRSMSYTSANVGVSFKTKLSTTR